MSNRSTIILFCLMLALMTACTSFQTATLPDSALTQPVRSTTTPTPTSQLTPSPTLSGFSDGPLLLLQTDLDSYAILDFGAGLTHPFTPPGPAQTYRLAGNLSPSGRQMLFTISPDEVIALNLQSGAINATYQLGLDPFDPGLAVAAAQQALPELDRTPEQWQAAVESAYSESVQQIRWYQTDEFRLIVLAENETDTTLSLDDLFSGTRSRLENEPGLVEDYWPGPDGKAILLKKGVFFEPGVWEDDAYYLINVPARQTTPLALPPDVKNPSVRWFGPNLIGITHETLPAGGRGFSLVNTETRQATQIVSGSFASLIGYQDHILLIRQDTGAQTTTLQRLSYEGNLVTTQTLSEICYLNTIVNDQIILNCETESLRVDEDLQAFPFGDPITQITPAPDGQSLVLITQTNNVLLLDAALERSAALTLSDDPLEIRWLPNSSGFLYRTRGKLFLYDLEGMTSQLWLESDIFSDYTNINAAWVNLN